MPDVHYKEYLADKLLKEKLDQIYIEHLAGEDKDQESSTTEKDKKVLLKQMITFIGQFQQNEALFIDYQKALDQFKHL